MNSVLHPSKPWEEPGSRVSLFILTQLENILQEMNSGWEQITKSAHLVDPGEEVSLILHIMAKLWKHLSREMRL